MVAGYSALFVFGSSLAEAERLERHQRLVEQIRSGLSTGALSLPPPMYSMHCIVAPNSFPAEAEAEAETDADTEAKAVKPAAKPA